MVKDRRQLKHTYEIVIISCQIVVHEMNLLKSIQEAKIGSHR